MLFDLRARGRRRTVQAVYLTLAVLMGGSLVLLGVGSDAPGGLLDALGLRDGTQGATGGGRDILRDQEKAAVRRTQANPRDPAAWAALARIRFQLAGQDEGFDPQQQTFTAKGRAQLTRATEAWDRYLALNPARPDPATAAFMVQAFGALNQPAKGVRAAEIVAEAQPSSNAYFNLARFAYAAGQTRKGDLAAARSVALAPADQRAGVKALMAQLKRSASAPGAAGGPAGSGGSAGGASVPPPASP